MNTITLSKDSARQLLDKNGKFTGNPKTRNMKISPLYFWCYTWSDYVWCILNDIKSPPICKTKQCNNITKKYGWHKYREFCSTSCSNAHKDTILKCNTTNQKNYNCNRPTQNKQILNKLKLTNQKRYGVENVFQSSKCMGYNIINIKDKTNIEQYYYLVWKYTNINNLNKLNNINKRGIEFGYSLDHKYSISQGFQDNILPCYIGAINNLEILSISENSKKSAKCSISKKELFSSFYKIF